MKNVPISEARRLAKASGATLLVIIGMDDTGNIAGTTYGATRRQCAALGKWLDDNMEDIAVSIDDAVD